MNLTTNRSIQLTVSAIALSTITGLSNPTAASAVTITYEAPNVFSANTSIVGSTAENTFESVNLGNTQNYAFDFVDAVSTNNYRAIYDNLQVTNYGSNGQTAGAGYAGKFAANTQSTGITNPAIPTTNLTFTNTTTGNNSAGVKYFGMFFSSLDSNNELTFFNGTTVLAQLSISNFPTLVNNSAAFIGGPYSQPGTFFNFYADGAEQFTKIAFTQKSTGGGFEHDNHTFRVPNALAVSGTGVNLAGLSYTGNVRATAVPEPFTIIGTLIGGTAAFRMRKKLKASTKA